MFEISGGDILTVSGEELTFERALIEVDGEIVFEERAYWKGNVTASFRDIILQTESVMAIFDGADVRVMEAGPEVTVVGLNGRAMFNCADVVINLPTSSSPFESYSGVMNNVRGYYRAYAHELGIEGTGEYEVNFTADVLRLETDEAVLERPKLSFGDLDNPELAIQSKAIRFEIGVAPDSPPGSVERTVLGAEADTVSVILFGQRINIIPFPVRHGFFHKREPGWSYPFPIFGWEGDEGFRWDQFIEYDFADEGIDDGPTVRFRFDTFPMSRSYPEIIGDFRLDAFKFRVRAGYRREEDSEGDGVPVRAEPEIDISTIKLTLGTSGFIMDGRVFWGHLRDMTEEIDLDRWGFNISLEHPGIWLDDYHLSGGVRFTDLFYQNGDNFRILEKTVRLRYAHYPRWSATLTYRNSLEWGDTPFRFDVPQIGEEIGLREITRLSRRWGAGFDYVWNFDDDDFSRRELHLTHIFDSFQVSLGYDLENESVRVRFDLPGNLR